MTTVIFHEAQLCVVRETALACGPKHHSLSSALRPKAVEADVGAERTTAGEVQNTTTQRMGEGGRAGLPAPRSALPSQGSGWKQRRKELDILQEHCRAVKTRKRIFLPVTRHTV